MNVARLMAVVGWFGLTLTLPAAAQSKLYQPRSPRLTAESIAQQAVAPSASPAAPSQPISFQQLEQLRRDLPRTAGLTPAQRQQLTERLDQAQHYLHLVDDFSERIDGLRERVRRAPDLLAQAKRDLMDPLPAPQPTAAPGTTLGKLHESLAQAERAWDDSQRQWRQLAADADVVARRRELADIRQRAAEELAGCQEGLQNAAATPSAASPYEAAEWNAKWQALLRRIALLDLETDNLDSLAELNRQEAALARRTCQWCEQLVEGWRRVVAQAQGRLATPQGRIPAVTDQGDAATLVARQAITNVDPELRGFAERNIELQEMRDGLLRNSGQSMRDLQQVRDQLQAQKQDLDEVREKVRAGRTSAVALLLRNRRDRMLDTRPLQQRISYCDAEMQAAQAALQRLRDERMSLSDIDSAVIQAEAQLIQAASTSGPAPLLREDQSLSLRALLLNRRDLLDALIAEFTAYHDTLSDLELRSRELLTHSGEYAQFIDNHVLWLRSEPAFGRAHLERAWKGTHAFGDVEQWTDVVGATMRNAMLIPGLTAVLLVACFLLFALRPGMKDRLHRLGERAESDEHASLAPTLHACLLTLALSVLWPLGFWTVGWWMTLDANASELTLALGHGLRWTSVVFFVAETLRHTCRRGGLAGKHFDWQPTNLRDVYNSLTWLMMLGLPLVLLVTVLQTYQVGLWRDSLGRLAYVIVLAALALGMQHLMHPRHGALQKALAESRFLWLQQLRYVWYALAIGAPLALAALALLGYTYTAQQLMRRVMYSFWLVLGMLLAYALLARAAKLAFRHLQQRPAASSGRSSRWAEQDERSRRRALETASVQIHQLLHGAVWLTLLLGGWAIWSGVFPAIRWLDESGPNQLASTLVGGAAPAVIVSWMDLLLASFVALVAAIAVKTLPGLIELAVLQHLPLDEGARHAVMNISRYLMALLGVVVICGMLGVSWSSVQWLVVALTIGLGFGLNEIFANVVAGLVLLLERPVRMGDYVSVSGMRGRVSKILMRATILTDDDNREVVIPNRKLLTDEIVNWTYSDTITRVIAAVRLPFRADLASAQQLLLKLAAKHAAVLEQPQPAVLLTEFGADGMHLELRVYVQHPDQVECTGHDLHVAIARDFEHHGIHFARAQHDIHVRSVPAGGIRLTEDDDFDSHAA